MWVGSSSESPLCPSNCTEPSQNRLRARLDSALTVPCYVARQEIRPNTEQGKEDWLSCGTKTGLSPCRLHNLQTQTPNAVLIL